jgi:cytochrome c553
MSTIGARIPGNSARSASPALENPTTPAGNAINNSLQNAPTDRFLDVGLDSEYQFIDDENQISIDARWTHENQNLDASYSGRFRDQQKRSFDSADLTASYYWHRKLGASLSFFNGQRLERSALSRHGLRQFQQQLGHGGDRLSALAQRETGPAIHRLHAIRRRFDELRRCGSERLRQQSAVRLICGSRSDGPRRGMTSMKYRLAALLVAANACLAVTVAFAADNPAVMKAAEAKATTTCQDCHGSKGDSVSATFPRLNGQQADYITAQLKNFRDHSRSDPHAQAYMWGMASQLDDSIIVELGKYYAGQTPTPPQSGGALAAEGKKLYLSGAPAQSVPACVTCHGAHMAKATASFRGWRASMPTI